MVRKLPWRHGTVVKTTKDKARPRDNNDGGQSIETSDTYQGPPDEDESHEKESNDSDILNYRITESEFVDTARYFTKDLHQQAYERLVQQQQKEIESKNTLSDLLEQPALPLEEVFVPTSTTKPKAKSEDPLVTVDKKSRVAPSEVSHLQNVVSLALPQKEEDAMPLSNNKIGTTLDSTVKVVSESKQTTAVKLSDAAAARRRKRQQTQKAEVVKGRFI